MSFTISPEWHHTEQRTRCKDYITANLSRYTTTENDSTFTFLPITAITALSTYGNIKIIIDKDPRLSRRKDFPDVACEFFTQTIADSCPSIFAACIHAGLSTLFLRELWNHSITDDHDFPVSEEFHMPGPFAHDLNVFKSCQPIFCAPVLALGRFTQRVSTLRAMPWTWLRDHSPPGKKKEVVVAQFHQHHVVAAGGMKPGTYEGDASFFLRTFGNVEEATKHAKWEKRKLGFTCDGVYYLMYGG